MTNHSALIEPLASESTVPSAPAAAGLLAVNTAPTFTLGTGIVTADFGVDAASQDLLVQSDGKILVAGYGRSQGHYAFALARYNADGSPDTAFGTGGQLVTAVGAGDAIAYGVALQGDGKILVTGYGRVAGTDDFILVRYNANGSLDSSFDHDGIAVADHGDQDYGQGVAVQADGKIVVAGRSYVGSRFDFALARYNPDGSLDSGFSGDGRVTTALGAGDNFDFGNSVALQADGRILVAGASNSNENTMSEMALVRYNADGSLDISFSGDGKVTVGLGGLADFGNSVTVQADGKILLAGTSQTSESDTFALVRLNTDGSLDTTFGGTGKVLTPLGTYAFGLSVTVQADGRILVAGSADGDLAIVRYEADGRLDTGFGSGGTVRTGGASGSSVTLQADGKILVAGRSQGEGFAVFRYNTDGSLDNSFPPPADTLRASPSYTENQPGVVLDAGVQILDAELSLAHSYNGASLTLTRHGGASAQDIFGHSGTLTALAAGAEFAIGDVTIGRVAANEGGTLVLVFNAQATQALVSQAMQQITYANTSDAPSGMVQIDWTFSDGNTGAQGTGGALGVTGSTTVRITAANDAPVLVQPLEDQSLVSQQAFSYTVPAGAFSDPDLEALTYTLTMADGNPLPSWLSFQAATRTLSGTPGATEVGTLQLRLTATDGASASVSDNFKLTVTPSNTMAPTVQITDNLSGTANRTTTSVVYSLAFSEAVTGLDASDFTVSNGTVTGVAGSGANWTVNIAPAMNVATGVIGLTLKAGGVTNQEGSANAVATNNSQALDTAAPVAPKLVTNASFQSVVDPRVTFQTSLGTVVFELDPDQAPATVANMLAYVNTGFYDGTLFHRVVPGFVVQGGGFNTGLAYKAPTYAPIVLESNNGLSNLRGTLAMARTNVADSATSQFFVNLVDNAFLNYAGAASPGYAVFGRVVSGMAVIDAMAQVPTTTVSQSANVPVTDVTTITARQTLAGSMTSSTGVFTVSGIETGAQWAYSLDGGAKWSLGVGSTLSVPAGSYAPEAILVVQMDASGNLSLQDGSFSSALVVEASPARIGTPAANILLGAGGPDTLSGLAGNDVLLGVGGSDHLDGGTGIDTAVYAGNRAGYAISRTAAGLDINGPEGADTLAGIERLQFADITLALDTDGNAGQAYRLYQAAFNRAPDGAGLGYWVHGLDAGLTLEQVASGFIASAEFQGLYGANPTNDAFVTLLYTNVLHRAPDAGGFGYWVDQLARGLQTRPQVLAGFSESAENKAALLPAMQNGIAFLEPYHFTGSAGADVLAGTGAADTLSGLAGNDVLIGLGGNDRLDGGVGIDTALYSGTRASHTVTRTDTGLTVAQPSGSDGTDTLLNVERLQFADLNLAFDVDGNAGEVYRLYQAAFARTPDAGGLGYWIDFMDRGTPLTQVATGFINSPEFQGLYGANPTHGALITLLYDNVLHRAPDQSGYNYWLAQMQGGMTRELVLIGFSESPENQAALLGVIQDGIAYLPS